MQCTSMTYHLASPAPRDIANRSGIRPSQLKAGMAQASLARDADAAPSTPNFLVEADGVVPTSTAMQRALLRPSSLAFGGGAAPERR